MLSRKVISIILVATVGSVGTVVGLAYVYGGFCWTYPYCFVSHPDWLPVREGLNLELYEFHVNNVNLSLYIRNTGGVRVNFTSYVVTDDAGNTYTQRAWTSGPTIEPDQVMLANIGIYTACGCGNVSGSDYAFVAGHSYTVILSTSGKNQFGFILVR